MLGMCACNKLFNLFHNLNFFPIKIVYNIISKPILLIFSNILMEEMTFFRNHSSPFWLLRFLMKNLWVVYIHKKILVTLVFYYIFFYYSHNIITNLSTKFQRILNIPFFSMECNNVTLLEIFTLLSFNHPNLSA